MLLCIHLQNADNANPATESILSNMHQISHITLFSTLFRLDLPPFGLSNLFNKSDLSLFNSKKMDEETVDKF